MTRYLSLGEVLRLHARIIVTSGGADGLRDLSLLESAVGQPRQSFDGKDLYETLPAKASAIGFSLIMNHPFVDGNKRIGHAALEATLSEAQRAAAYEDRPLPIGHGQTISQPYIVAFMTEALGLAPGQMVELVPPAGPPLRCWVQAQAQVKARGGRETALVLAAHWVHRLPPGPYRLRATATGTPEFVDPEE